MATITIEVPDDLVAELERDMACPLCGQPERSRSIAELVADYLADAAQKRRVREVINGDNAPWPGGFATPERTSVRNAGVGN